VDFLLVLIELFLLGVTATLVENKSKIGFLKAGGSVCAKFSRRRGVSHLSFFARIVRPMNVLHLVDDSFHTKKLCSRLSLCLRNAK